MSILKQVLTEAFASVFRKSSVNTAQGRVAKAPNIREDADRIARTEPLRTSGSGMKVVILNWKRGENDPFTVMNTTIRQHFQACGKNVEVIEKP